MRRSAPSSIAGLLIAGLCFFTASTSVALCVNVGEANLRSGPGVKNAKTWEVFRYMPFQRVAARNGWFRVRDVDRELHWISSKLVSNKIRCGVVKSATANVRKGPGTGHAEVAWSPVDKYFSFKVLKQQGRWLNIEDELGEKAWIARSLVWTP